MKNMTHSVKKKLFELDQYFGKELDEENKGMIGHMLRAIPGDLQSSDGSGDTFPLTCPRGLAGTSSHVQSLKFFPFIK